MATTTPNYGWDVPTSTDYVKDGATAIETLGDDIDASLFSITGGKNVGLVHINTTTFTSQTSVTISNVFTSAYDNYRIVMEASTATTNNSFNARLASGGTPLSTTTYTNACRYWDSGNGTGATDSGSGQTSFTFTYATITSSLATFDIISPALAKQTFTMGFSGQGTTAVQRFGSNSNTTAYDGINFFSGTANSGTVRIYGYRN